MTNNTIYELINIVKNAMANQLNVQLDGKPYKSYEVKVVTEHSYTVNARSKDEAALKAIRKYDEEGKSKEPVPAYGAVIVNGEEYGGEEEEEDEICYELYCKDGTGYRSGRYKTIDDILEDISIKYRLTLEEENELEDKIIDLLERDSNDLDCIGYELPFISLDIWRVEAD